MNGDEEFRFFVFCPIAFTREMYSRVINSFRFPSIGRTGNFMIMISIRLDALQNIPKYWLAALLFFGVCLTDLSADIVPIRILPLGDSITFGLGSPGGYRAPLYNLLTNAGFKVDFVGTQTNNGAPELPDPDHEGHSGWRIDQINSILESLFNKVADIDIILLLIGTNDYGTEYDTPHAIDRLENLVARMATNRPFARIIVANLLEREEPYNTWIQATFNPLIPDMVERQQALGREVYFDDIRSAVPLSDLPDQLHPDALGYAKMATNWFGVVTNLFTPEGSKAPPAMASAYGLPGLTNATIVFSKPVSDESANPTNFTISGGVAVLGAVLDATTKDRITLLTGMQEPSATYVVTATGIHDRTVAQLGVAPNAAISFISIGGRGAGSNVPEAAHYQLVYSLDIPEAPNYSSKLAYSVDRHADVQGFTRIAYYLELEKADGRLNYIWVSMDAFTDNINKIGVPTLASGAVFQRPVAAMNVVSSVAGIVTGTNLAGGNVEFWPYNYDSSNAAGVPEASDAIFDWGDHMSTGGNYGSMQVHHHDAHQVLFAFNRWAGFGGAADIGIGNNPNDNPDYTFAANASNYAARRLQVFVRRIPAAPRITGFEFTGPSQFTLHWEAQEGVTYSIFRKFALDGRDWTRIGEVAGVTNAAGFTDFQSTNSTSFYQIVTQDP